MRSLPAVVMYLTVWMVAPAAVSAQNARPAKIVSTAIGGVLYVEESSGANGISARVGRWDTPYPYPDTGEMAPGLQPQGTSIYTITIDVNDGGLVSFSYRLRTYDAGIYDWYDISLDTPNGTVALVRNLGKPGSQYGTFWQSSTISLTQDLKAWRNQRVTFRFEVVQDGWGDQTMGEVIGFAVRTCSVAPLIPIDELSEEAQDFEAGNRINTEDLNDATEAGLNCMQDQVAAMGGHATLNSAYRPADYQAHLQEVWDRHRSLRNRREPECAGLVAEVNAEFAGHELLARQRPAAATGPHTQGNAIDLTITGVPDVDAVAAACGMDRPNPGDDPVHFVPL